MTRKSSEKKSTQPQQTQDGAGEPTIRQRLIGLSETPGVLVPPAVLSITRNERQALVLAQVLYWHDHGPNGHVRATAKHNGWDGVWAVFTHAEWAKQIGLQPRQFMGAVRQLVKQGLLLSRTGWHGKQHATWLQPCQQKFDELFTFYESLTALE